MTLLTGNVNESTIERWITEERVFAEAKFEAPPSGEGDVHAVKLVI